MPNVEVDEVELLRLRRQDNTIQHIYKQPEAKKLVLQGYKKAFPDATIPELEAEAAARAPVQALEKDLTDLRKEIADEKAEREKNAKLGALGESIEKGKAKLRKAGWTDEGIAAVEKLMEEKGTTDVEMAAAYYEQQHPPQAPATPRGTGGFNFVENVQDNEPDLKKLLESRGNNEALADKMARDALNEMRGTSRR